MTTKVQGTQGIEFPDSTQQASAANKPGEPGTIAASAVVTVSGSTATVYAGYNVGIVGRPSVGRFNVTLSPSQPDDKLAVCVTTGNLLSGVVATVESVTPNNVALTFYDLAGVLADPSSFSIILTRGN